MAGCQRLSESKCNHYPLLDIVFLRKWGNTHNSWTHEHHKPVSIPLLPKVLQALVIHKPTHVILPINSSRGPFHLGPAILQIHRRAPRMNWNQAGLFYPFPFLSRLCWKAFEQCQDADNIRLSPPLLFAKYLFSTVKSICSMIPGWTVQVSKEPPGFNRDTSPAESIASGCAIIRICIYL